MRWHRSHETSQRLDEVPGVGPALATALVASIADPKAFRSGRDFSAWIGLVPRQHSSGGKERLGSISKQGDRYLRSLFIDRIAVPLLGFNLGLEAGQLIVIALAFVTFAAVDRAICAARSTTDDHAVRLRTLAVSAVVMSVATRWMLERYPW